MNPDLHKQLEALHSELARTQTVDGQSRDLLVTLLNDISRLLESKPVIAQDEDASLAERLDEMAVQFEAEHPGLGTAIRRVLDTLAKAGI